MQIREAMYFLLEGKAGLEREHIAEELVSFVRRLARGDKPELQSSPFDIEEHAREGWARMVADLIVGGVLGTTERTSPKDRQSLLREIVRLAFWHMPNAVEEARGLVKYLEIERLRQPHPQDAPAPEI